MLRSGCDIALCFHFLGQGWGSSGYDACVEQSLVFAGVVHNRTDIAVACPDCETWGGGGAFMLLLAVCVAAFIPFPGCGMCRYSAELRYFFPLEGILYFMIGACIRLRRFYWIFGKMKQYLAERAFVTGCVAIVVGVLLLWLRVVFVLAGCRHPAGLAGFAAIPFAMYGMFALCSCKIVCPQIATLSFPVFLLHRFFVWGISGSISGCPQVDALASSFWWYVARIILAASCSVVVALAAKKSFPRFSAICFGGR